MALHNAVPQGTRCLNCMYAFISTQHWSYPDTSPLRQFPIKKPKKNNVWLYWLVVVLVGSCHSGSCPRDSSGPGGQ